MHDKDSFFLYKLAQGQSISVETEDFKTDKVDNWPSIVFAIWNPPDKQVFAIQKRTLFFKNTDDAERKFSEISRNTLSSYHLNIYVESINDARDFWGFIKENEGQIQKIEFEFITPNMANISKSLTEELKQFAKDANSHKNNLHIQSDLNSSLNITENNLNIKALAEYTSKGGGNVKIKRKNSNQSINITEHKKTIKISTEEFTVEPTEGEIQKIITLLKNSIK